MKQNKKSSASTTAKLWNITQFQKRKVKKMNSKNSSEKLTQKYNNKKYILLLTLFRSSRPWAVLSSCRQQCRVCRNQTDQIEKTYKHEQTDKNEQIKWVNLQKWANKQNEQMDKTEQKKKKMSKCTKMSKQNEQMYKNEQTNKMSKWIKQAEAYFFFFTFFLSLRTSFLFLFVCFFVFDHSIHQISGISLVKARPPWLQISNLSRPLFARFTLYPSMLIHASPRNHPSFNDHCCWIFRLVFKEFPLHNMNITASCVRIYSASLWQILVKHFTKMKYDRNPDGTQRGNFPPHPHPPGGPHYSSPPSSLQLCWWFAAQKIYGVEELETHSMQAQSQTRILDFIVERGVERDSPQWPSLDEKGPLSIWPTLKRQRLMPLMSLTG